MSLSERENIHTCLSPPPPFSCPPLPFPPASNLHDYIVCILPTYSPNIFTILTPPEHNCFTLRHTLPVLYSMRSVFVPFHPSFSKRSFDPSPSWLNVDWLFTNCQWFCWSCRFCRFCRSYLAAPDHYHSLPFIHYFAITITISHSPLSL